MAHTLTLTSPQWDASGKFGYAIVGGNAGASYGNNTDAITSLASGALLTFECQIKTTYADTTRVAACLNTDYWIGVNSSGKLVGSIAGANLTSTTTVNDGAYHHVAISGTVGGTMYLLVDGARVATGTDTGANSTPNLFVGRFTVANTYDWGANGRVDEVAVFNTARYPNATYTAPTAAYTGSESGLQALYHLEQNGTDSTGAAPPNVTISPTGGAVFYSPYNWDTGTSGRAVTVNAGAYFRTMFSGTTCALTFDMTNPLTPYPQIWYAIDGQPFTQATIAASVTLTMPSNVTGPPPFHMLEVVVKSTTETQNRWNAPSNTQVALTGIVIDSGATAQLPSSSSLNVLFYGDSITEGVRTLGQTQTNDTDRNDARAGWAYRLGQMLGAEVGVVGFGGTGITVAGSGNVPALPNSYNLLRAGVSRSFSPAPSLIVLMEGTNDSTTNTTTQMTTVLNGLLSACPSTPILVIRPFNGTSQASYLQAAIAACSNPSLVTYKDTTGLVTAANGLDSLGLHPTAANDIGIIAPGLFSAARTAMQRILPRAAFRQGFHF